MITENNGIPATMLVGPTGAGAGMPYPVYQGGGFGGGSGMGNDGGWWIVLLIIVIAALGGNWGGNNNGGGFGGQPIIVNDGSSGGAVQRGFDQAAVIGGITAAQTGINALSTQLCGCCCDMQSTVNAGINALQAQMYGNQLADLERSFAAQTATTQGITALGTQFAECCCENRLASERLNATIARENCADREALNYSTRDIIENANRNNQSILDKLCQLELSAKDDRINDLERQLTMANLAASQTAQTSRILADNAAQTVALEQYLNPVPVPAYVVQNPNCCYNPCGTNCGCGVA